MLSLKMLDVGLSARVRTLLVATVALGMSACGDDVDIGGSGGEQTDGSSGGETDTEGEPNELDPRITNFVASRCDQMSTCDCTESSDVDACVDESEAVWKSRMIAGQERGLTLDEACLDDNLVALETAECRWPSTVYAGEHLCDRYCSVFYGSKAAGQPCEAYDSVVSDCAPGLMCNNGACIDPCVPLTGLSIGSYCRSDMGGDFDDCTEGAFCDWETSTCQPYATLGQACDFEQCGPNLWCNWETQVCQQAASEGSSCEFTECVQGLQCRWAPDGARRCVAPALVGESCQDVNCAEGLACDGFTCINPPGPGLACAQGMCSDDAVCDWDINMCRARPTLGASCLFGVCADGLWCDTSTDPVGICSGVSENGLACTGHAQCESAYCPRGFCEARPGLDEDCENVFICEKGLVCNGLTCQPTDYRGPAACVYDGW